MKEPSFFFGRLALCLTIGVAFGCGSSDGGLAQGEASGFVFDSFGFLFPADGPSSTVVDGFDLDGRTSTVGSPAEGECAHDDFTSPDGAQGVDYGFLGMIEQFSGFQEGQLVDGVINASIKSGDMTTVLELGGLDDNVNDDEVTVQFFSSLDTPRTGTDGNVLPGGSVTLHSDTRLHSAIVTGELVDGTLVAGPIDIRLRLLIQIVTDELFIHDAMVHIEPQGDGTVRGFISGLWDVEDIRRIIIKPTADNGEALEFSEAEGMEALFGYADADFNSDTEMCDAISVTYKFSAVPHFIVR